MKVAAKNLSAGDYIKLERDGLNGVFCVHVKEFAEGDQIGIRVAASNLTDRRVVLDVGEEIDVVRPWPGHRNNEEA